MGSTPKLALPYPEDTDPLANMAAAVEALANALDVIPRAQGGTVAWPGAAAGVNVGVAVVFPRAFTAAPVVVGVLSDSRVVMAPSAITAAGFTFNGRNLSAAAAGAGTGYWIAYGIYA